MVKRKPLPYEYCSVTINNFSRQTGIAPVVFDHWVHRQRYTCRICHVDIGFGMTANSTKTRAVDNSKGYYCGTCHNGKMMYDGRKVFESCDEDYSRDDYKICVRCHVLEPSSAKQETFYLFAEKMPREVFGNGIDWEKAERKA